MGPQRWARFRLPGDAFVIDGEVEERSGDKGILAVVQIFPSGLRILALNRNATVAVKLAQGEAERVVGRSDQLPEMILALLGMPC